MGCAEDMRRSFRTRKWPGCFSQGVALRWYAVPRWGKNSMPQRGKDVVSNKDVVNNKFCIWPTTRDGISKQTGSEHPQDHLAPIAFDGLK